MAADQPYLITGRIRNNRLWEALKQRFPKVEETQRAYAEACGVKPSSLNAVLNMRKYPRNAHGKWTVSSTDIARKLGVDPEWLFDDSYFNLVDSPVFSFAAGVSEWSQLAKMGNWPLKEWAHSLRAISGGKK